jgi:hypothetical protein
VEESIAFIFWVQVELFSLVTDLDGTNCGFCIHTAMNCSEDSSLQDVTSNISNCRPAWKVEYNNTYEGEGMLHLSLHILVKQSVFTSFVERRPL